MENLSLFEKMYVISKFLLDFLDHFIAKEHYHNYRNLKKEIYKGPQLERIKFTTTLYDSGHWVISQPDNANHTNRIKSLVMKFIQMILVEQNEYCYTKLELAERLGQISGDITLTDAAKYYLTRGNYGTNEHLKKCIGYLFSEYKRLFQQISDFYSSLEMSYYRLNVKENPTILSDRLWLEFTQSPSQPTAVFKSEFDKVYSGSIQPLFLIPSFGEEFLPESLRQRTYMVDQRSPEWMELLTFYRCGNNNGIAPVDTSRHITEVYYNLIRGCLMELFIIRNLDFSEILGFHVEKVSVGLVVEEKDKRDSIGVAPDLILIDDNNKIIPVEIKTVYGDFLVTGDLVHSMELAKKQIKTICRLAGAERGLILLVNISSYNEFSCRHVFSN
jgi:hypothetical protein